MGRNNVKTVRNALFVAAALLAAPAFGQGKTAADQPADYNMQILREKLQGDKKLLVATNMDLTDAEAKAFWPVYDEYQKELQKINERLATTITAYAREFKAKTLTDARAKQLIDEAVAVEDAEVRLKHAILPKLAKALPGRKVARYMQIESKIRAVIKYEIAAEVPLAQ